MDLASNGRAHGAPPRAAAPGARPRRPLRRVARALAIAVVGAYVLYLVIANGLLWGRVLPRYLDDAEEELRISYASAWTFWPGRVRVEALRVASQDSNLEMEIRARRASARVALLGLFGKKVELSGIRAEGVSVRARGRRPEADAIDEQPFLPPMAVWGALAIEPPVPGPPTDPNELWHIVLDDAAGSVDEIWIEGVRVTGRIRVRGTFDFRPMMSVIVDDVRGIVQDGRLEAVGRPEPLLAESVDGAFRFAVPFFDVPAHALPEVLIFADADVEATGLVSGAHLATALQEGTDEVTVVDGTGAFHARLAARQGRFLRGSRLDVETAHLVIGNGPLRAVVRDVDAAARATSDEEVTVRFAAATADAGVASLRGAILHVEAPSGAMKTAMRPTFMDPSLEGGEVSIPAANLGLAALDGVTSALRIRRGIAFARGHAAFDRDRKGSGELHLRVDDLDGAVLGVALAGRARSAIQLEEIRLGEQPAIRARGSLALDDVAMTAGDERVAGWWGRLELAAQLEQEGEAPWTIGTAVRGRLRDARPAVAILDGGGFVPGIVADQLTAEDLTVEAALARRGERMQIDVVDARGDGLRLRGRMVKTPDELRGSYLVETSLVDVGVSIVREETQIQLLAGDGWLERERKFLGGFGWPKGAAPRN